MSTVEEYKPYADDSSEVESGEATPRQFRPTPWQVPRNRSRWLLSAAVATAAFFAGLSIWLGVQVMQLRASGSFGRGFPNELGSVYGFPGCKYYIFSAGGPAKLLRLIIHRQARPNT